MSDQHSSAAAASTDKPDAEALARLVAEADTGGREPRSKAARTVLFMTALAWALFQLWYASPLPFQLRIGVFNATEARAIHLAFALFLVFAAYPATRKAPRDYVPWYEWLLGLLAAGCSLYIFLFQADLARRPGLPTSVDIVVAVIGVVMLLEAARRALGPALPIVGILFLCYAFFGPYLPDLFAHRGASIPRAATQYWLTSEGVFGVALGVSTAFVFLFVLFGSLLERAGAGNYFIKVAFALLGHFRGGPAKAAVLGSAATGLISGSSVANVVTTGTFTIPLMKRVGYPPVKAGAIEVSASVNGQILPPVMGAAAFLIAEYVGIPYSEVVRHAIIPALLTCISLFYVVDIEARKYNLTGLPRKRYRSRLMSVALFGMTAAAFVIFCWFVGIALGWTRDVFGPAASWAVAIGTLLLYLALLAARARFPDLDDDDPNNPDLVLPDTAKVAPTGIHYILPVFILVWCLMVEELSPGLSAFYGTCALIFLVVTQKPLIALFRRQRDVLAPLRAGFVDLLEGLVTGSRNMVTIAIATAAAGIIVGTVALTGIGLVMTEIVISISGGNLLVMLLMTAVICMVLGLGMPTTANYVVVATLIAPVIVEVAALNGLAVALVAVHLYVFYFGLMADVTPPVGLASFAASAISRADPVRTGVQAFRYEMRTAILPLIFIFNHQLLMIGVTSWWGLGLTVLMSLIGMLMFVSVTQQVFISRSRIWETVMLLVASFMLFVPGQVMDRIVPPTIPAPASEIAERAAQVPAGQFLTVEFSGIDISGNDYNRVVRLPMGEPADGATRLSNAGIQVVEFAGEAQVTNVRFRSQAERLGVVIGDTVSAVMVTNPNRPPQELIFIPALLLIGAVAGLQWRRRAWDQPGMPRKREATSPAS
ncbi:TRAP transporter permease [Devosia elaeis]|uniref:C4-dicarboxylate ABC transporter n=1 Tax=Devosia elaeis TaxID=1770058 RepID=A0A178I151_9HYPH|nr:TRAP transporter permease [Devosia elaeis]OAM78034.1 C4-dicarboxylate ABC transporter [Devosia elaeis]